MMDFICSAARSRPSGHLGANTKKTAGNQSGYAQNRMSPNDTDLMQEYNFGVITHNATDLSKRLRRSNQVPHLHS